jgi:methylmalonyl-CoA mutase
MTISLVGDAFPHFSEEDWSALVARSTGGRTPVELASRSDDGIPVGPLYVQAAGGQVLPRRSDRPWTIVQRVDIPDIGAARDQIRADLAGGAGGLELVFAGSLAARGAGIASTGDQALADLFEGLGLTGITLRIDAGEATPRVVMRLLRLVEERSVDPGVVEIVSGFDPIAALAARGSLNQSFEATGRAVADAFEAMQSTGFAGIAVVADGRPWHDGGASEVQELAAVLSAFVAYLRLFEAHGIGIERAMERIAVVLSADADQFLTIAKFRAIRLLHARLVETMDLPSRPCRIHAETSWRMMSRRDAHMNLLRTTSAAFAAGVGGADSVTVLPFTAARGLADPFARRLARNGQTILIEEAGLGRVADSGAGAGAFETLAEGMAEKAWDRFQAIEHDGGLLAAVKVGTMQLDVAAMRDARLDRVRAREIELIGTTAFVHLDAVETKAAPAPRGADAAIETADRLVTVRLAEPFEALRDRADDLAAKGMRPAVFLVGLGSDFTAAANLAAGFLASGGVTAIDPKDFPTPETAAEAFARSGAPFACICLSRDTPDVASLAMALRAAGARRVYVATVDAQPVATIAGIDEIIAKGTDAVALIGGLLDSADAGLAEKR